MRAYVDESGDPGIGAGSRWLVFGAIMVSEAEAANVEEVVRRALQNTYAGQKLSRDYFHFTDLEHELKQVVILHFKEAPWVGCLLARDTSEVHSIPFSVKALTLYAYMASFVIERASRRAEMLQEQAWIYFEESRYLHRNNIADFRTLVGDLAMRRSIAVNPKWVSLDRIFVMPKGGNPILSIADGLSHAGYRALEPHRVSKKCDMTYYSLLAERLWGANPLHEVSLYDHGLLLRPKRQIPKFIQQYPWMVFGASK